MSTALARFLAQFSAPCAEGGGLAPDLRAGLQAEGALDEALFRLKQHHRHAPLPHFEALKQELEAAARLERARRGALWHLDVDRRHLRLAYARGTELADLNPAALLALLGRTLDAAGLTPALSLEKRPRPLVTLGPPLPLGTVGLEEWADVVLARRPDLPPEAWPEAFDAAAPAGLAARRFDAVPAYATPVLDLAREAHWTWDCPEPWLEAARAAIAAFLEAPRFEIEKGGKADGKKVSKRVDIRPLFHQASWEGHHLTFTLRVLPGEATHPRKLLGGILGRDPMEIQGLVRTGITLAPDPRLQQAERFEPKLRNIFEDAVALGAASNITLVDEDDDEPLRLG